MKYGHPLPRGKLFEGVYIDDRLVCLIGTEHELSLDEGPDKSLSKQGSYAYAQTGLLEAKEKGFGFCSEASNSIGEKDFLG